MGLPEGSGELPSSLEHTDQGSSQKWPWALSSVRGEPRCPNVRERHREAVF